MKQRDLRNLLERVSYNGVRLNNLLDEEDELGQPITNKRRRIMAAAITVSVLRGLRNEALTKPLRPDDIERAVNVFLERALIEEYEAPEGGLRLRDKT